MLASLKQLECIFGTRTKNSYADPRVGNKQIDIHPPPRVENNRQRTPQSTTINKKSKVDSLGMTMISGKIVMYQKVNSVIHKDTGKQMTFRNLTLDQSTEQQWKISFARELGRLTQGFQEEKGTDTMVYVPYSAIPVDRCKDITYGRLVVDYKPHKSESNRTRLTVGGNLINSPGDVATGVADITTIKLHLNSTISTNGAR